MLARNQMKGNIEIEYLLIPLDCDPLLVQTERFNRHNTCAARRAKPCFSQRSVQLPSLIAPLKKKANGASNGSPSLILRLALREDIERWTITHVHVSIGVLANKTTELGD